MTFDEWWDDYTAQGGTHACKESAIAAWTACTKEIIQDCIEIIEDVEIPHQNTAYVTKEKIKELLGVRSNSLY